MSAVQKSGGNLVSEQIVYPFANPSYLRKVPPICIQGGEGAVVQDSAGNFYIDGQGGLWNVNAGHGRPEIKNAISAQMEKLSFYSLFGNTTNEPAIELAALLCRLTSTEGMGKVFFSSGGSEAVESAIKLVRRYWQLTGEHRRKKFISLHKGYHGVTLGALSLIGRAVFREAYEPLLPGFFQIETPYLYRNPYTSDPLELGRICADLLEREIVYQGPETVAAFIAEPVQGAGGVIVPPPNFWPLVREVCTKYGVLLIADEVVTGFGRSGTMMGCRTFGVKPDVMTLAKGINSGYVPLGATMISERIAAALEIEDDAEFSAEGFQHGNTYAGHPLACAAAIANLRIVESEDLPANAREVGAYFLARLQELQQRHESMGDVRGLGLMLAIEFVADTASKRPFDASEKFGARVWRRCVEAGVLVRNIADTFIISPPLVLTKAQVDIIVGVLDGAIAAETKK